MIHAYSLVHDDLPCMDDDDMRRGKPSNHKVFGEGIAVLTGDALLTHAFDVLANLPSLANTSAEVALRIVAEISRACGTGGSHRRTSRRFGGGGKPADAETLDFIHRNKTGALFKASVRTGAMLGGASDQDSRTSYRLRPTFRHCIPNRRRFAGCHGQSRKTWESDRQRRQIGETNAIRDFTASKNRARRHVITLSRRSEV